MNKTLTIAETAERLKKKLSTIRVYASKSSSYLDASDDGGVTVESVLRYERRRDDLRISYIKNLDKILVVLEADDDLTDEQRGYTSKPGRPKLDKPLPAEGPTDTERKLLKLRGEEFLSFGEIAKQVRISRQRVEQVVNRAVERLYCPE